MSATSAISSGIARSLHVLVAGTVLATAVAAAAGCGDNTTHTTALFAIPGGPAGDDFYALPFPNDFYRHADGTLDLTNFPTASDIVDSYRVVAQTLDGFGLNAAIYTRFDDALDPTTLPDPAGSIVAGASVYLVNVDPASPDFGVRTPITADFAGPAGGTIGANHLTVRPYPGFGLDEGTTYALVVTNRVHDVNGDAIQASDEFIGVRESGGADYIVAARAAYAPLFNWLDAGSGDQRADVVTAAVFTTQHMSFIVPAIRKGVLGTPAPIATGVGRTVLTGGTPYQLYTGMYTAPNFQSGTVPYLASGGEISVGSDGAAIVQRIEPMRFALTLPNTAMPAAGWPLAIYQHGTGGDYESFVDDGTGMRLAAQGIATISTDQVLHGIRNPNGDPEVDFFDFGNPYAARDNALQGVADAFSQLRLAKGLNFTVGAGPIVIDPTKVMFFGHSQGSTTGPGFVAFEPTLSGAVMSGCAGVLYLGLLNKTQPINIPALVTDFIRDDPVDADNPSIALVQMWMERADPANFAPLYTRHPPTVDGVVNKPRNVFQSEGFIDTYAPNPGIEAFATAIGGDLVKTVDEQPVLGLTLRGRAELPTPVSNNLNGATAVLAQYKQAPGSDGHFVVFEVPAAEAQSAQFLGTLAATGTATVVNAP